MPEYDPQIKKKESAWGKQPDYRIDISLSEKPIRVIYAGEIIADTQRALHLQEQGHSPVYYFPQQDVRMELLHPTTKSTFCPFKGDASHWSLTVGNRHVAVAAWSYAAPFDEVIQIKGYIAFYSEAGDLIS